MLHTKRILKCGKRTKNIEKKLQADVFFYLLDGHPSGIKEKIQIGIGDKLEGKEQDVKQEV